jgi:hypothetical protein
VSRRVEDLERARATMGRIRHRHLEHAVGEDGGDVAGSTPGGSGIGRRGVRDVLFALMMVSSSRAAGASPSPRSCPPD